MQIDVLCIGHAAYDLSMLVPSYPIENSKLEIRELRECGGGPAANAAYLLARWGARSSFAGQVGDDDYGRRILAEFKAAGVDTSLLELREGYNTPFSVIIVNSANASRTIINRKSATATFHLELADQNIRPAVLLFDGHELDASLRALEQFPEADSILDAGSFREGTARLAKEVDYLVASERFALQAAELPDLLTPAAQERCIGKLREEYDTSLVVTLGERGLIASHDAAFLAIQAFPVAALDTTGAGDVFHGAFAYAVLKKFSFVETLRFASMAAALSVREFGGRSSIPTLDEVEKGLAHAE